MMSDKPEGETPEQPKADPQQAAADKPEAEKAKPKKNGALVPLLIILAFAGFAGLVMTGRIDLGVGTPKPKMIPLEDAGTSSPAPTPTNASEEKQKTAVPATPPAQQSTTVEMRLDNSIGHNPTSTTTAPAFRKGVSSEEAKQLLDAMQGLSDELRQLRSDQQAMQSALHQQQRINLEARLRWIADASSHLPQIQLAWEEISLLPGLSTEQRQKAETMLSLAQKDEVQVRQWQMNLEKWASTLTTPARDNVIPMPEHPWLAWIASQFSLSRAPSAEEKNLDAMRLALLDASKRMALESWPNKQEWQAMRARLLLQLQAMQLAETATTPELGLPENFEAIAKDIETLRQTARQWLEENA